MSSPNTLHENGVNEIIDDFKVEEEDFSNTVDEYESPDMGGFNELSEPNY